MAATYRSAGAVAGGVRVGRTDSPTTKGAVRVTSYSLRKGSVENAGTDAVVVGVVTGSDGPHAAAGGEGAERAYGRKFGPLLSSLGFTGKAGEVAKVSTGGLLKSPLLVLVGLGARGRRGRRSGTTGRRRGRPGDLRRRQRGPGPADAGPRARPGGHRGLPARRLRVHRLQDGPTTPERPGEVVVLSAGARSKDAAAALEKAQVVAAATALTRDWVNTPPGDLTPPAFADVGARRAPAPQGRQGPCRGARREAAGGPGLRRHPRRRPRLGRPAPAGPAALQAASGAHRTWPWSARGSPSTPAAWPSRPPPGCAR